MTKTIQELFDLTGKVAIVTGGGLGIGQAAAFRLAEAGAKVVIADIDMEAAAQTADRIKTRGGPDRVAVLQADVRNRDDAVRTVSQTIETFDRLDILVNNAGIYPLRTVFEIEEELWDRVLDTNLRGSFFFAQAAARRMKENGQGGKIINLASVDAFHPNGMAVQYNASKGGVVMMTKALALELAPYDILVNAIAPGGILTPGAKRTRNERQAAGLDDKAMSKDFVARVPLGRMGNADDIGTVVLFLASAASDYMTGSVLLVDGGFLLS